MTIELENFQINFFKGKTKKLICSSFLSIHFTIIFFFTDKFGGNRFEFFDHKIWIHQRKNQLYLYGRWLREKPTSERMFSFLRSNRFFLSCRHFSSELWKFTILSTSTFRKTKTANWIFFLIANKTFIQKSKLHPFRFLYVWIIAPSVSAKRAIYLSCIYQVAFLHMFLILKVTCNHTSNILFISQFLNHKTILIGKIILIRLNLNITKVLKPFSTNCGYLRTF